MSRNKFFTDGTPEGTLVYDKDGKRLTPVSRVHTSLYVKEGVAKYTIEIELLNTFAGVEEGELVTLEPPASYNHVHVLFNGDRWQIKGGLRSLDELKEVFKLNPAYELHYHSDKWHTNSWLKVEQEVFVSCHSQFVSQAPSGGSA